MSHNVAIKITAILGFLAVALGAFGAHGLEQILKENGRVDTWQTACHYHFFHLMPMLFLCSRKTLARGAFVCFLLGTLVFSGSLYVLSITNIRWLGAITPLGGVAYMVGWLWMMFAVKEEV